MTWLPGFLVFKRHILRPVQPLQSGIWAASSPFLLKRLFSLTYAFHIRREVSHNDWFPH